MLSVAEGKCVRAFFQVEVLPVNYREKREKKTKYGPILNYGTQEHGLDNWMTARRYITGDIPVHWH